MNFKLEFLVKQKIFWFEMAITAERQFHRLKSTLMGLKSDNTQRYPDISNIGAL